MSNRTPRLTEKAIASAQIEAFSQNKPVLLWCPQLKGFGLRISPPSTRYRTGKTTYIVQKRVGGRKSKETRFTFGEYPSLPLNVAYDQALTLISDIRSNNSPAQKKRDLLAQRRAEYYNYKTSKFTAVFDNYRAKRIEEYKHTHHSQSSYYFEYDIVKSLDRYVHPHIGKTAIQEIKKEDIRLLLKNIPTLPMRRKVEQMLAPVFKYALIEDIITSNPFDSIELTPKGKTRDRVLSPIELYSLWNAALDTIETDKPLYGHFYKLLMLTTARLNEIAKLEISELDLANNKIVISAARMKMDEPHVIPLSSFAVAQINKIPRKNKTYVFSYGRSHLAGFSAAKKLIDSAMLPYLQAKEQEFKPWVNHTLRATFSTHLAARGVSPEIIDRCLAHVPKSKQGSSRHYQHYLFLPERREAMQKWSDYIEKLIS